MTKRISQANTAVVPGAAAAKAVAAATPVVPAADADVAAADKAAAKGAETTETTVVTETVAAVVAPAPIAMVAQTAEPVATSAPAAQAEPTTTAGAAASGGGSSTLYIVGGVLLAGGGLALALSGKSEPTNSVTFSSSASASIAENSAVGANNAPVLDVNAAASSSTSGAITYTLGGADASAFTINATTGEVRFVTSPNFEAKPVYNITVTASVEASGTTPAASASQAITINVTNVNEAPSFANATATATVVENTPITTAVYTSTATDPDANTTLTYTLSGTDAAAFAVSTAGVVTLRAPADFETKSSYSFVITASDGQFTTSQTVTVNVTDANDPPAFTSTARTTTLAENTAAGFVLYAAGGATDQDPNSTITYSLTGTDAAALRVNATTGAVTLVGSPDFEAKPSYSFNLVATDQNGGSTSQANTLTITNVNEAPTFAAATATATVVENTAIATPVYTATATDPDANTTLTYTLGGTDAAAFAVAANGAVSLRAPADFETKPSYSFTVTASDGSLSTTQTVTLNVTNVNEAPTFTSATRATTVAENVAAGTALFTAGGATDQDVGNTVTYSLSGTDASAFAVNAATGAVTFVASPNFEAKSSYAFNLVATDQAGLATTQANTVTITNVNEAPSFAVAARTVSIDENVAAGTVVPGSATATDPDAGAVLTYSLSGADAGAFTINGSTGVVSLVGSPDFETKPVYNFNVVATDQGGLSASQAVTLNINDLVEPIRLDGGNIPAGSNTNFDAAVGNAFFTDSAAVGNVSTIANFGVGDIIQTDVERSNYTFSAQGSTLVISSNVNGVVSQISLTGVVPANTQITNEISAETALGFDFFRSSAPAASAATTALSGTASYNAANSAVTYTEDSQSANTSTITNFSSDDRIVVSGVNGGSSATSYSFSSSGSDLIISFNNGNGQASLITLVGVANPNVFVRDEASAEQAVGFDFFRYG
ncbi:cadherin domain-containing protein [Sphingomonas floccifaciens]|uniref:Cadherin domain-containing protein n=1 Tax=Sphingomonas floccifaciens TaxID=1844115 RepID=A0ABW4NHM1_9SPHN